MTLWIAVGLLGCLLASLCLYLAAPHQRWRAQALPARPTRAAAALLWLLSLLALGQAMQPLTAVLTLLHLAMLALCIGPYLGALRPSAPREPHGQRPS